MQPQESRTFNNVFIYALKIKQLSINITVYVFRAIEPFHSSLERQYRANDYLLISGHGINEKRESIERWKFEQGSVSYTRNRKIYILSFIKLLRYRYKFTLSLSLSL